MFITVQSEAASLPLHVLEVLFQVYAREYPPAPYLDVEGIAMWIEGAPEAWKVGVDRLASISPTLADQWIFHCLEESSWFVCHPFDGSILQIEVSA